MLQGSWPAWLFTRSRSLRAMSLARAGNIMALSLLTGMLLPDTREGTGRPP